MLTRLALCVNARQHTRASSVAAVGMGNTARTHATSGLLKDWLKTEGGEQRQAPAEAEREDAGAMADRYPIFHTLHSYLTMRSCTKLGLQFWVGKDKRSRVHFWDFGTITEAHRNDCSENAATHRDGSHQLIDTSEKLFLFVPALAMIETAKLLSGLVPRDGVEPPTPGFSGP